MKIFFQIVKFKYTIISLLLWLILYYISFRYNYDIFEEIILIIQNAENYEIDELILYGFIMISGISIDLIRELNKIKCQEKIQKQRLRTMHATLSTVQDIVGNSFNGLQLLKIKIDMGVALTNEDLQKFDQIIFETTDKIAKLRNLDSVEFKNITLNHVGLKTENIS